MSECAKGAAYWQDTLQRSCSESRKGTGLRNRRSVNKRERRGDKVARRRKKGVNYEGKILDKVDGVERGGTNDGGMVGTRGGRRRRSYDEGWSASGECV